MVLDLLVILDLAMSSWGGSMIAKRIRELEQQQSNESTRDTETS
jgi:CheY-like chemotaxis protein